MCSRLSSIIFPLCNTVEKVNPGNYEFEFNNTKRKIVGEMNSSGEIFVPPTKKNKKFVLYFPGNGEEPMIELIEPFILRGMGAMNVTYSMSMKNGPAPTINNFKKDIERIRDFLKSKKIHMRNVVVFGRSIGTGIATMFAHAVEMDGHPVHRLCLDSAWPNLKSVMRVFLTTHISAWLGFTLQIFRDKYYNISPDILVSEMSKTRTLQLIRCKDKIVNTQLQLQQAKNIAEHLSHYYIYLPVKHNDNVDNKLLADMASKKISTFFSYKHEMPCCK
jgi:pimeloyl-ACP methyl ester carboxylesterase